MPITAIALLLIPGRWTPRRVCAGMVAARASVIFHRLDGFDPDFGLGAQRLAQPLMRFELE